MKPIARLTLCFAAAILSLAPARAEKVVPCSPDERVFYYVLWGRPVPAFQEQNSYTAPFRFVQELQPHYDNSIIMAICDTQMEKFENQQKIKEGDRLGDESELYEVMDAGSGALIGTLWRDEKEPYDQGGGIALMRYRTCQVPANVVPANPAEEMGVVNDVGAWSLGLGVAAINGTDAETIEKYWMAPIRDMVEQVANTYMEGWPMLCGPKMDLQTFLGKYQGEYVWRDYLQVDPDGGFLGKPSM
jgi:hypothetical protein